MTILDQGLNRIRDIHRTDITFAQSGTDASIISTAGTGLRSPIAVTSATPAKKFGAFTNQFTHTIPSTTGTGETYRETIFGSTGSLAHTLDVYPGVLHTANNEIVVVKTMFYRRR